ncbi:hypothetical protein F5B19DRAFT_494455 [Rostrohypoxylon terebratum]|nr:hypothetical protein F5B19DRAFT_494455 [Rostrohypoxylon terebratum]
MEPLFSLPTSSPRPLPYNEALNIPPSSSQLSALNSPTPTLSSLEDEDLEEASDEELTEAEALDGNSREAAIMAEETLAFWKPKKTSSGQAGSTRMRAFMDALREPTIRGRLEAAGVKILFKGEDQAGVVKVDDLRTELSSLVHEPAFGQFAPQRFTASGDGPCTVKEVSDTA